MNNNVSLPWPSTKYGLFWEEGRFLPTGDYFLCSSETARVHRRCRIDPSWQLGNKKVIFFCMPSKTEGVAYSIGGNVLFQWRRQRRKGNLVQKVRN